MISSPGSDSFVDEVLSKLTGEGLLESDQTFIEYAGPAGETVSWGPYHRAAAVLSNFVPELIRPVRERSPGDKGKQGNTGIDALLADSVAIPDPGKRHLWMLKDDIRVAVLRELRVTGGIQAALEANPALSDDLLQETLRGYLLGQSKPLMTQTLAELSATQLVCRWLWSADYSDLPDGTALSRRIEWLTLLAPFEHLASDEHFRGRARELTRLREYAGILPPGTLLEAARRAVADVFDFVEKPPLLIRGVGGVGKSTLVARFILEHARAHESDRFPFAYLDYDRPEIDVKEPLTLLAEAVRQLGVQYPLTAVDAEVIRSDLLREIGDLRRNIDAESFAARSAAPALIAIDASAQHFSNLVRKIGAGDRPVLFVIDTFEELQQRNPGGVAALWSLLEAMQRLLPRLRVVLAGRGNVEGRRTDTIELTGLDTEAAVGYLMARGFPDEDVARRVAKQIGGSPLSLKLAAELAKLEGLDERGRLPIEVRNSFYIRFDDALLQRQLLKRVLSHIPDERIRRLAYRGLLLRRITPDLILHVLAEPCDLRISTIDEAVGLFDQLRIQVSLVTASAPGVLRYREDLRVITLELLRVEEPEKVHVIHRRAVDYYAAPSRVANVEERAEEIYHRLVLDDDPALIDERWLPGVEPHLVSALRELSGRRRAWLAARLGLDVDPETRALADLEDWERITAQEVQGLLSHDQVGEALTHLRMRTERTPSSPLPALEARALARLQHWQEAIGVVDEGYARAIAAGDRTVGLALALQGAELVLLSDRHDLAGRVLQRLADLAAGALSPHNRIAVLARQYAVGRWEPSSIASGPTPGEAQAELGGLLDDLSGEDLASRVTLARWAAASLDRAEDASRLARIVRATGVPRVPETRVRQLAAAIATLDDVVSNRSGEKPGLLARRQRVPVLDTLTSTWTRFLLTAGTTDVQRCIAAILRESSPGAAGLLVTQALATLMLASLGFDRDEGSTEASRPAIRGAPRSRVQSHVLNARLRDALVGAFQPDELDDFVRRRLGRRLDTVAFAGDAYPTRVFSLVNTAAAEDWLSELVARALDARSANQALASVASELGISSLSSTPVDGLEAVISSSLLDITAWRERLGEIEGQICRVERDGKAVGTGFLVGPDLLLTADYVFADRTGRRNTSGIVARFDFRTADKLGSVFPGTEFRLAKDGIVARRPFEKSGLGYALLRLDRMAGTLPVGGSNAEASARLRGWISPSKSPLPLFGEKMIIVQHAHGEPLKLSVGTVLGIGRVNHGSSEPGFRSEVPPVHLVYDANTDVGSSGAPCFSNHLDPLALHHGFHPGKAGSKYNFGVLLSAIGDDLEDQGLGGALGQVLA